MMAALKARCIRIQMKNLEIIMYMFTRHREKKGKIWPFFCDGCLTQTQASPGKTLQLTPHRELGTAITKHEKGEQREMKKA